MLRRRVVFMLLLLAAGAQSSVAEEGKKEFTATLANGVTVELIGVSYHSTGAKLSEPKRWWRPDGSDLDAEPYRHPRRCTTGIPGYYTREFAFRITGADEYSCATFNSSGRTNVQPVIPLNENNESIPDLLAFADRFKNSQSEDTIRIGVSIEPWEKVEEWEEAWHEYGITAPVVDSENPLVFTWPRREKRGAIIVEIVHTYIDQATRLLMFDLDGNMHENTGGVFGEGRGLEKRQYWYWKTKLEDMQRFEFQKRPYQWAEFRNVSLEPGIKAEVEPKVKGIVRDTQGRPVAGVKIDTLPSDIGFTPDACVAVSDDKGRFEVCWPDQGEVEHLVFRHIERNLGVSVPIDENTKALDVKLYPGVNLTGKIIDTEGKPIEQSKIWLAMWIGRTGWHIRHWSMATDSQGRYEVKAAPAEYKYGVNAEAEGYGYQYVNIHTDDVEKGHLKVPSIVLAVANLSVSGVVVDQDDRPVASAKVYTEGRGQPHLQSQTDSKGKFTIEKVCAGTVSISSSLDLDGPNSLWGKIKTQGGASDVKLVMVELNSDGREIPQQSQRPPSLVGKALPGFEGIEIEFDAEQAKGKKVLVCFFDIGQRPSRHCVIELAKKAGQLKEKGVSIVAVQASKIDKGKLDKWVEDNNIGFAVGMIRDEEEEIRFKWGVKSLPWLILTDEGHIVRAMGFGLGEVEAKLKEKQTIAPSTKAEMKQPRKEPKVSGIVRDRQGRPVAGVQVAALPMSNRHVLTDAGGKFEISWKREWAGGATNICLMAQHTERNLAALVDITHETKTVDIKLEPALTLTGTIVDTNGMPISGAKVGLSLREEAGGWICGTPVRGVVTDGQGRYEFGALPQRQDYGIGAKADGYVRNEIVTGVINAVKELEEIVPIVLDEKSKTEEEKVK